MDFFVMSLLLVEWLLLSLNQSTLQVDTYLYRCAIMKMFSSYLFVVKHIFDNPFRLKITPRFKILTFSYVLSLTEFSQTYKHSFEIVLKFGPKLYPTLIILTRFCVMENTLLLEVLNTMHQNFAKRIDHSIALYV